MQKEIATQERAKRWQWAIRSMLGINSVTTKHYTADELRENVDYTHAIKLYWTEK